MALLFLDCSLEESPQARCQMAFRISDGDHLPRRAAEGMAWLAQYLYRGPIRGREDIKRPRMSGRNTGGSVVSGDCLFAGMALILPKMDGNLLHELLAASERVRWLSSPVPMFCMLTCSWVLVNIQGALTCKTGLAAEPRSHSPQRN
ncbi:unnamed protein product [Boreogadus saida]